MSKTTLKKVLDDLSKEQLAEMILDIYSNRKDAKDYFEFYLNPDVDKLFEKYYIAIYKELHRFKRYYSAARVSRIKKAIKEFASFSPGENYVLKLYISALRESIAISDTFMDQTARSFAQLLKQTIDYANKNGLFATFLKEFSDIFNNVYCSRYFKRQLTDILREYGIETDG